MPATRPLTLLVLTAALAAPLGGCLPAAAIPGAIVGAAGLYCVTVSQAGKTMARDALSGGVPLIACPDMVPADHATAPPGS
jgi:hypothetical protein